MIGKMLGRDPHLPWGGGCGGACCNTNGQTRKQKKTVKHRERRETRRMAKEAIVERQK